MTTTDTTKLAAPTIEAIKLQAPKPEIVTLEQLARDMKVPARDARMLLRLAAKQTRRYPNLAKEHIARQPWQWATGSKAFEEAKTALTANGA